MSAITEDEPMEQYHGPPDDTPKQTYKSFKKKYNKMRHVFKDKMKLSDDLFYAEQKAIKVARRLQEQNDQLLELLLDSNGSSRVPSHLQYDLRSPTPLESAVPALEPDAPSREGHNKVEYGEARAAMDEARREFHAGHITADTYRQLEAAIHDVLLEGPSLPQLSGILHTTLDCLSDGQLPEELAHDSPAGFLSLEHEEDYLNTLDTELEGLVADPINSHPIRSNDKSRDAAMRNPVSVYNWLRKHQPQVFLQDSDSSPDNSKKSAREPKGTKRSRESVVPKQEPEVLDDEGFVMGGVVEAPLSSRSKRKRDDEPYRPKGGSTRPYKRKKASSNAAATRENGEDGDY